MVTLYTQTFSVRFVSDRVRRGGKDSMRLVFVFTLEDTDGDVVYGVFPTHP